MGAVERLASVGGLPTDTEDERIRKGALTLSTLIVCALTPAWVITYFALGFPVAASIPLAYLVFSLASLAVFARTRRFRAFRTTQFTLMLTLPFALQWALGGFVPSSGVAPGDGAGGRGAGRSVRVRISGSDRGEGQGVDAGVAPARPGHGPPPGRG